MKRYMKSWWISFDVWCYVDLANHVSMWEEWFPEYSPRKIINCTQFTFLVAFIILNVDLNLKNLLVEKRSQDNTTLDERAFAVFPLKIHNHMFHLFFPTSLEVLMESFLFHNIKCEFVQTQCSIERVIHPQHI